MHPFENQSTPMIHRTRYSLVLWILILGMAAGVAWAFYFRIDQTTRGVGTVITTSRIQIIQAVDGGVLESLKVKEGDRVKGKQILAIFNQTRFSAAVKELEARLAALYAREARLHAEITEAKHIQFPKQIEKFSDLISVQTALFLQRVQGMKEALANLNTAVSLAKEERQLVKDLSKTGDVSRSEVLKAERMLNDTKGAAINLKNKYFQDVQLELAKVEDEIGQNEQILAQRAQQLKDSVICAPVAGIVKNVRITTLGGVLRPGDELMQIIPVDERLIVEAKIRPADIADIHPGLTASLKFDAFDYTIFGAVEGRVMYVSGDTLREQTPQGEQTYYRVHLETLSAPVITRIGRSIQLLPGMTAQVDIRTGQRTVLNFLLKPLKKTLAESFGEK